MKPGDRERAVAGAQGQLLRWLLQSEWRAHPLRTAIAVLAIALGVALGYAIELINGAAFNEFSAAAKSLSGQSDLQVRGRGPTFDESIYPWLAQHAGVALASPVLEIDASLPEGPEKDALKTLGLDVFRASEISPDTIGVPAADRSFDTLMDDAIFLSPAAMQWLNRKAGDTLPLRSGTGIAKLRVAGTLLHARAGQRVAVMDIGAAQWLSLLLEHHRVHEIDCRGNSQSPRTRNGLAALVSRFPLGAHDNARVAAVQPLHRSPLHLAWRLAIGLLWSPLVAPAREQVEQSLLYADCVAHTQLLPLVAAS